MLRCGVRTHGTQSAAKGASSAPDGKGESRLGEAEHGAADFVQSLDRGLAVIRAFSASRPELTLSEVARETGISRAAARRFLLTLEALEYVGSRGRQFYLRPRVLDLGYAYLSSFTASEIAQSHLEALSGSLQEACSCSVLDGTDIVYAARAATNRIMTIGLSVGRRLPAYATSMGRVLLAELPDDDLDEYFSRSERPTLTGRTVTGEAELRAILERTRTQGWALIDQELEDGVRSVAAPIREGSGKVVAAINVSAHASRVSVHQLQTQFLPRLLATAQAITTDLAARR